MGFSLQEDGYQDAGAIEKGVSRRDVRDVKARVCRKDDNLGILSWLVVPARHQSVATRTASTPRQHFDSSQPYVK